MFVVSYFYPVAIAAFIFGNSPERPHDDGQLTTDNDDGQTKKTARCVLSHRTETTGELPNFCESPVRRLIGSLLCLTVLMHTRER